MERRGADEEVTRVSTQELLRVSLQTFLFLPQKGEACSSAPFPPYFRKLFKEHKNPYLYFCLCA